MVCDGVLLGALLRVHDSQGGRWVAELLVEDSILVVKDSSGQLMFGST